MAKFRFQDLNIWKEAIEIGDKLFEIADTWSGGNNEERGVVLFTGLIYFVAQM